MTNVTDGYPSHSYCSTVNREHYYAKHRYMCYLSVKRIRIYLNNKHKLFNKSSGMLQYWRKLSYGTHSATGQIEVMVCTREVSVEAHISYKKKDRLNDEIRVRGTCGKLCENIREARLKWLGRLERKPEEDLVMIT